MSTFLWLAAVILIVVGIVGIVVPVVPGVAAVFLGLLLAAWADDFSRVGAVTLIILGMLTLASFGIDFYMTQRATRKVGASKLAIFGATVGMFVGIFLGFVGVIVGPFVGAFLGEYIMRKDLKQAGKAGAGTWFGLALGVAAKIALVFGMIGIFVLSYLMNF